MKNRTYIAIDLKSFYASVECVERGLDPLKVNLVVADPTRTDKTICLAVSPSLKAYGIPGRARLFEVNRKVSEINSARRWKAPHKEFSGKSYYDEELKKDSSLELDFIIAPPQMAKYMKVSSEIFEIYLKYVAPEDIHVYSIDEVFMDVTPYLETYKMTPRELTMTMIKDVLAKTGITATAGIGTNLYLCKIAMDIEAKHIPPDENGVRIAELDEMTYRKKMWNHKPLTDFWRIGGGYASKLNAMGLETMGDVARFSLTGEDRLYKMFGVNAELLIDHAWGWEPTLIKDIKSYVPENNSISSGQVLSKPYPFDKARLVMKEMTDSLSLDLVRKRLVADQIVITVNYDSSSLLGYMGETQADYYGKKVPKNAHGSINLDMQTSSTKIMTDATMKLFDRIVDSSLTVRRMYVVANHVIPESKAQKSSGYEQLDFFTDYEQREKEEKEREEKLKKERRQQEAILSIKEKYGKNSILKGMNFQEDATAMERNSQVGGHKA